MKKLVLLFVLGDILLMFCSKKEKDVIVPLKWVSCGITQKAFMQNLADEYEKRYGAKIILEEKNA